jgi:hypothetical protein
MMDEFGTVGEMIEFGWETEPLRPSQIPQELT